MRRSCTTTGFQAMHSWVQFAHQSRHLRPMNAVTGISPLSGINQHRFFIIRHQRIFPQHNLNTASSVLLKSRINYNSCSRRFCTTNEDKFSSRSRRVEINLSETSDKVALSFIKKYGKKVAIEWPKKGLKFAALATGGTLLAVGGASYLLGAAAFDKVKSLFGGRAVGPYDPAAAKQKQEGRLKRFFRKHIQQTLAYEMSRQLSGLVLLNQNPAFVGVMGGEIVIDLEQEIPTEQLINPEQKEKHPRFEFKKGRSYEYDEFTIVSASGKKGHLVMYAYLDDDSMKLEEEDEPDEEKKKKKSGKEKEKVDESTTEKEKSYNWCFLHISAVVDGQQYVIHHDPDHTENDMYIAPDARYSDGASMEFEPLETAEHDDDNYGAKKANAAEEKHSEFIDVEVISDSTTTTTTRKKKKKRM